MEIAAYCKDNGKGQVNFLVKGEEVDNVNIGDIVTLLGSQYVVKEKKDSTLGYKALNCIKK